MMRRASAIGSHSLWWLLLWTPFVALMAWLLHGCGPVPEDVQRLPAWLAQADHLSVGWSVDEGRDVARCTNGHAYMPIADFPAGWWCRWDCGLYEGTWQQVWVDVDVGADGLFVPADAMPVYTAQCFSDSECATCNFE